MLIVGQHQNIGILDAAFAETGSLVKTVFFVEIRVFVLEDEGGGNAGQLESLERVQRGESDLNLAPKIM